MPRVMFSISYGIKPDARDQYLQLIKEMKVHLTEIGRKGYSVYEAKGKANHFTEVFLTGSLEEFDALDENMDEKVDELIGRIEGMVDDEGMKYSTLVELE